MADPNDIGTSIPSREEQEDQVLWAFRAVFQNVHEELLDNSYGEMTEKEQALVEDLYSDPTIVCFAAGLGSLAVLKSARGLRNYFKQRRLRQQHEQFQGGQGYSMNPPPPGSFSRDSLQQSSFPPPPPFPGQNPPPNKSIFRQLFKFSNIFDLSISTMVGLGWGAYNMEMNEHEGGFYKVPLVEGRSAISDAFCSPFIEEYEHLWKLANNENDNEWQSSLNKTVVNLGIVSVQFQEESSSTPPPDLKDILQSPQLPNLQAYLDFVKNCKRRQSVEQRIRQERGLASYQPVAIPHPLAEAHEDESSWDLEELKPDEVTDWVSDQEDSNR